MSPHVVYYVLWALPRGSKDRLDERPMTSFPITKEQAKAVEERAQKDGWHGFRLVEETNMPPDFTKGINPPGEKYPEPEPWVKAHRIGTGKALEQYWLVTRPRPENSGYDGPDYAVRAYYTTMGGKPEEWLISHGVYETPLRAVKASILAEHGAEWSQDSPIVREAFDHIRRDQQEAEAERFRNEAAERVKASFSERAREAAAAVKLKKGTATIRGEDGERQEEGYVVPGSGLFAFKVHKNLRRQEEPEWSITHIPSGFRLATVEGGRDYVVRNAFAILLATGIDWNLDKAALERLGKTETRLSRLVRLIRDTWYGEAYELALQIAEGR
ncbi:MAG: hypothetical protein ACRDRF_00630 [Pseudonocardiaceae bacterium]